MDPQDQESIARGLLEMRRDPVLWVQHHGDEMWADQRKILRALALSKQVAVAACHGIGKDWTAARAALWFLYCHAPSLVLTTGPTDRQVRGILWKELGLAHGRYRLPGKCLTQQLILERDWYALGFTAPQRDETKFQGFHEKDILVVVDEACGVSPEIYVSIESVLSSENARRLEIGNPTDPLSTFAQSFKDPSVVSMSISCYETPNFTAFGLTRDDFVNDTWREKITGVLPWPKLITPEWVARCAQRWGMDSPLFRARCEGKFSFDTPDAIVPLAWILRSDAQDSKIFPSELVPVELGVDVASTGGDKSVIVLRKGRVVEIVWSAYTDDTMELVNQCVRWRMLTGATLIKVDAVGIGRGVYDRLNEMGEPVAMANASASASQKDVYLNSRAEWYWKLRKAFESQSILLKGELNELAAAQLSVTKWSIDGAGKIRIEPKEEIKKRLGHSPDEADALAIAYADIEPTRRKRSEFLF